MSRPMVMQGKPMRSDLRAIWSVVSSGGSQEMVGGFLFEATLLN